MKTDAIAILDLQDLLERTPGSAGSNTGQAEPEHPLARQLRALLENPTAHRIGDLARVVDHILREMTMLPGAAEAPAEPAACKAN